MIQGKYLKKKLSILGDSELDVYSVYSLVKEKLVLLGDIELRCIFSIFPGDRVGVKSCADQTAGDDNTTTTSNTS